MGFGRGSAVCKVFSKPITNTEHMKKHVLQLESNALFSEADIHFIKLRKAMKHKSDKIMLSMFIERPQAKYEGH